jgi:hypothetical protein
LSSRIPSTGLNRVREDDEVVRARHAESNRVRRATQEADKNGPEHGGSPLPPSERKGDTMAKGQQKSNKEIKKPKKEKPSAAPAASFEKGLSASSAPPKKKG